MAYSPKRFTQTVPTVLVDSVAALSLIQKKRSESFGKENLALSIQIRPLGLEEFAVFFAESCRSHKSHSRTVGDQATVTLLQEPPECTRVTSHFFFCSLSLFLSHSVQVAQDCIGSNQTLAEGSGEELKSGPVC